MIGDFANLEDMAPSYLTFNKMNEIIDDKSYLKYVLIISIIIDFVMTVSTTLFLESGTKIIDTLSLITFLSCCSISLISTSTICNDF